MLKEHVRTGFFLGLLLLVMGLSLALFLPYFITLALAATAAVILHPVHAWAVGKFRGRCRTAAFFTVFLTIIVILGPLSFLGLLIAQQAAELYQQISSTSSPLPTDWIAMIEENIRLYFPGASIEIDQYAGQALRWLAGNVQEIFAGTVRTILHLFLGIMAYYYMLKDGDRFLTQLKAVSPLTQHEDERILGRLQVAVNSVIRGSIIIAVLQGIATGVGLSIFGVENAVLLGGIAGIAALIPTLGTSVVLAPVIVFHAIIGEYVAAIGLTIWAATAVGLIDNFLHPILVGKGMRVHPFFIFFAVIGGITLFGMAGFVLGPLVIALLFALLDIFREEMGERKASS